MLRFLNFNFDLISLLIGAIGASMIWLLVGGITRAGRLMKSTYKESKTTVNTKKQQNIQDAYFQMVFNKAQRHHLAYELFALEEILVEPRVLVPPPNIDPTNPVFPESLISNIVPLPLEFPEILSQYPIPTFSLPEAIQNGGNYVLIGQAGWGKSTALASLALRYFNVKEEQKSIKEVLPIFLDVRELDLSALNEEKPFNTIETCFVEESTQTSSKRIIHNAAE